MAVDKVKPLKIENASLGGTENDPFPREMDPSEDYASVKGVAWEGNETALDWADSGLRKFQDSEVTTPATLKDAIKRLNLKDVDLTNLTMGYVLTWNNTNNRFELQPEGALSGSLVQCVNFGKQGSISVGSYIRLGELSSQTGWPYRGSAKIVAIYAETIANVTGNSIFQVVQRTAVGTYTDIPGATVQINNGTYKGSSDPISISLTSGRSLLVKLSSGSGVQSSSINVFMVPQ